MNKIKNFLEGYKVWILVFTGVNILFDIFVLKFTSDLLILFLTGLWILLVCLFKFKSDVSISLALGFLILCPFLLIFKKEPIAEQAAILVYVFLAIGAIQMFIENIKEKNKEKTDNAQQ
ncbi:MAG: hypothetical protein COX39_01115 [Candidatus Nealsonbacteria bacterium CG23_combo_of_CG06-09_8_20_14_all_40_13]|uniref:Uncharacterized protein n=1 Tax=Candidatus Nealsonbacteria bacterium CG23_combo_of_CG06-09_8_20_14_all_40_13 TaxID=1974724 RepID=A0A2G9YRH6_9BACT|nr:MAG: hypothetical protein COX39_01115 [Candidatus Nealsonbacteria bacterium CG23_combo_of_CG06-09_8_20_14_all_40_13]PIR70794.1 MAG: hypothetical protein COU44_03120 [Candidatus Nealsonbacteria bacterium CG10_big_fil_rev_8_21_14_0_10_40_24]PIU43560.1 MAG: hypothetical protein COS97_00375 [Candidatus Nealsonbacteria bacterium CG07_land_8_20_14_0_80_40_10]